MSSGRSSRLRLGLRATLTLWTTVVLAASLGAGFAWVHIGLRAVLAARNDDFLERKGLELAAVLRDARSGGPEVLEAEIRREVAAYEEEGLVVIVRRRGAVQVEPVSEPNRRLAERLAALGIGMGPRTIDLAGETARHRVMRLGLSPPWEADSSLDLSLSLAETEATLAQFDRRVAAGGLAFLGLAVLGGLLLSRQALRPVAQSIRTAQQLNPADLSARLPRTGVGDELDQLALTINDLLDRLADYHGQMTRFTADASHELRSPLGAMRAAVEVALQQRRTTDEYRDALESLGEQCDRMTSLVNALLTLARADSGQIVLRCEPLDLASLAREIAEMYQPLAEERGVALYCSSQSPVPMVGDLSLLRQLVTNLLDNAIKFTEVGGSVTIRVDRSENEAHLMVADTGIGIPPDRVAHVFERFYQADPARSSGGSGLGLSICRWIVEAHGGSIRVASKPRQGTKFSIDLPSKLRG
jgi:heavy metal sensor kinase